MNTRRKEDIALGKAISYFTGSQVPIFIPIGEPAKYDFIIDQGLPQRVQCKYTGSTESSGGYRVRLYTQMSRNKDQITSQLYKKGDFDLLFVYCKNNDQYLIPAKYAFDRNVIVVGKEKYLEYRIN